MHGNYRESTDARQSNTAKIVQVNFDTPGLEPWTNISTARCELIESIVALGSVFITPLTIPSLERLLQ